MHSLIVQSAVEERTPPTLSLTGQQRLYYLPHQRASIVDGNGSSISNQALRQKNHNTVRRTQIERKSY